MSFDESSSSNKNMMKGTGKSLKNEQSTLSTFFDPDIENQTSKKDNNSTTLNNIFTIDKIFTPLKFRNS